MHGANSHDLRPGRNESSRRIHGYIQPLGSPSEIAELTTAPTKSAIRSRSSPGNFGLVDRRSCLLVDRIDLLDASIEKVRLRYPFDIDALVILPDHLHAIWTLPPGDADFSTRWRLIKTHFVKEIPATEQRSSVHVARGERAKWQRRYWQHLIADERDWDRHVEYCYFNPVKHGLVERVEDWPHSTFHRDMSDGFRPTDWSLARDGRGSFGEE